jgi:hypothetical protein
MPAAIAEQRYYACSDAEQRYYACTDAVNRASFSGFPSLQHKYWQPRSRRLAPAHLIDGISSVCRNGEIKTERHRVSRDLAVRRVVLPG